ncbi:MAG: hypothetical protein U0840_20420 [Gemmataceae bacterium]
MKALTLEALLSLFPGSDTQLPPHQLGLEPPYYEVIAGSAMPEPYRGLLVHDQHMTVTVEAFHGGPVDVQVAQERQDEHLYARKISLTHQATGRTVLFGIVRIDLRLTSPEVRAAILARQTPLGRILIEHDVLRRIEPTSYLKITPGPAQLAWFGLSEPAPLYGRLAFIHCDGEPAIELLEVVSP